VTAPPPQTASDGGDVDGGGLARAITPKLLLLFIVGDILGGGIYALVGEVGAETGGRSGRRSHLPW
jgi:basic amino acid/polyamine antiporter, APA family